MTTLDQTFEALADPTRRAMLVHLSAGPQSERVLMEGAGLNKAALARHLDVLLQSGLVTKDNEIVRADTAQAREVVKWLEYYLPLWDGAGPMA